MRLRSNFNCHARLELNVKLCSSKEYVIYNNLPYQYWIPYQYWKDVTHPLGIDIGEANLKVLLHIINTSARYRHWTFPFCKIGQAQTTSGKRSELSNSLGSKNKDYEYIQLNYTEIPLR